MTSRMQTKINLPVLELECILFLEQQMGAFIVLRCKLSEKGMYISHFRYTNMYLNTSTFIAVSTLFFLMSTAIAAGFLIYTYLQDEECSDDCCKEKNVGVDFV
ncbi:hypothetical protein L596_019456 [Steinernema carpocapsae]|uniref:Uncharacterized protein n=1 Tax=Steinernema carpocapsae TaxID=34508 RepID=A0A4U5MQK5_STECR|nr:hypothetical protein L596_019456 [Steinernema carpocapsae]